MNKLIKILLVTSMLVTLAACSSVKKLDVKQQPEINTQQKAESDLYVGKIENLSSDFIRGVDISSYISEIESGVVFYDFQGNQLDEQGFFDFLAQCGVNWVRIRIWNDPYDSKGNSYGGGHNDVDTAIKLGTYATIAGLNVSLDFHYSDFWADPSKQMAPKAWKDLSLDDKVKKIEKFTTESLTKILKAGINVGMVQIGNEINNGLAGETSEDNIYALLRSASSAVRKCADKYEKDIKVAVHYANPETAAFSGYCGKLINAGVDFDVFGVSYYPFWHSTTEKLTRTLSEIVELYDKEVCVVETSYIYTNDDGDGFGNSVSKATSGAQLPYSISVQGQANEVASVIAAVNDVGEKGIGVFYWEPAWIPVGSDYDTNFPIWEANGSGWASSYSADYDPNDAGKWYGGSSWDNQAMFDFTGHPLESINVFKYVYSGTTTDEKVVSIPTARLEIPLGTQVNMPETIDALMNSDRKVPVEVISWAQDKVDTAVSKGVGTMAITGKAIYDGEEYNVAWMLSIVKINLVQNPGFEDEDMSMWSLSDSMVGRVEDNNKHSGTYSLKWYSDGAVKWTASQKIEGLSEGYYTLSAYLQGGTTETTDVFDLVLIVDGQEHVAHGSVTSWQNWTTPTVSHVYVKENAEVVVEIRVNAVPQNWGAWDDVSLYKD